MPAREDKPNAGGWDAAPVTQSRRLISRDTGSFDPHCRHHLDQSEADNRGAGNLYDIFVTTDNDFLRINLVLRKDRDGALFRKMADALAGVPERDRAEVVRRELSVWLALQPSPALPTPTLLGPEAKVSSAAAIGRSADHLAISRSPAAPVLEGKLDMTQLDGIDMELDFYTPKQ